MHSGRMRGNKDEMHRIESMAGRVNLSMACATRVMNTMGLTGTSTTLVVCFLLIFWAVELRYSTNTSSHSSSPVHSLRWLGW